MKKKHHHGALKAALLSSALELLDAKGIEAVSIRAVARHAGVSHAAPANHFPDLRSLLTAIAIHCFQDLEKLIIEAQKAGTPSEEIAMFSFAAVFHDFGISWPNRYRLMWRNDLLDSENLELKAHSDRIFELIANSIARLGEPNDCSQMSRVIAACSALHGYILLRIDGNFTENTDEKTGRPRHLAILDALFNTIV